MTDKEKFRKEVEKLKSNLIHGACASQIAMETRCKEEAYNEVLAILDTMQEEPVSKKKCIFTKDHYTDEDRKVLCDGCEKECKYAQKEEPVSEELEKIVEEIAEPTILNAYGTKELARRLRNTICGTSVSEGLEEASKNYALNNTPWDDCKDEIQESFKAGAKWQKAKNESITNDLGEYINELSKQFPDVSFAKLSRIAVRVAKWQKEKLWKHADGNDLPIFDREVIALLDNGKVVFAHRPPEYWDGKNIITGKVTRYYPKTYDKGGWNIPNIKYWLDVRLPKEIEL